MTHFFAAGLGFAALTFGLEPATDRAFGWAGGTAKLRPHQAFAQDLCDAFLGPLEVAVLAAFPGLNNHEFAALVPANLRVTPKLGQCPSWIRTKNIKVEVELDFAGCLVDVLSARATGGHGSVAKGLGGDDEVSANNEFRVHDAGQAARESQRNVAKSSKGEPSRAKKFVLPCGSFGQVAGAERGAGQSACRAAGFS